MLLEYSNNFLIIVITKKEDGLPVLSVYPFHLALVALTSICVNVL